MPIPRSAFYLGLVLWLMPGSLVRAQGPRMSWDVSAGFDGDAGRFSLAAFRHAGFAPLRMAPMRGMAMGSLVGHLIYGLILGGVLVRLSQRASVARV